MDENEKKKKIENILSKLKDVENKQKDITESGKFLRLLNAFNFTLAILSLTAIVFFFFNDQRDLPHSYYSKDIKQDIKLVIQNGADVNTVKYIFNSRIVKNKHIIDLFFKKGGDFYPASTNLDQILNDLKVEYFKSEKPNKEYYTLLSNIVAINNQINPFDKLDSNQKFEFENIRTKLDSNYIFIQEDFNRIVDELNNKNLLVNEYLEKSNHSYWISIVALGLTIVLSTIQIYQNRNNRKNANWINDILRKTLTKNDGD
jgi:hypothetical protein